MKKTALLALLLAAVLGATACGFRVPSEPIATKPDLRVVRLNVASANVYIVERAGTRLMIDAGNPGDEAEYERLMREHDIAPESIDALLLTHGHADHAGIAHSMKDTYGVEVIGGAGDQEMIHAEGDATVCPTSFLARLISWSRSGIRYPAFDLDIALPGRPAPPYDLQDIGMPGLVWPWPGHTDGSVVAVIGEHAFVGDLIRGGILDPTEPTTHFFMCDLEENRERIRQLLQLPGIETWHPGHFGPLDVEDVREYLDD